MNNNYRYIKVLKNILRILIFTKNRKVAKGKFLLEATEVEPSFISNNKRYSENGSLSLNNKINLKIWWLLFPNNNKLYMP